MHEKRLNPETLFLDQLRNIPVRQAARILTGIHRLKQLREDLAGGPGGLLQALLSMPREGADTGDFLHHFARLQMRQVQMVCDFAADYADSVFREVRRRAHPPGHQAEPVVVRIKAAPGKTVHKKRAARIVNHTAQGGKVFAKLQSLCLENGDAASFVGDVTLAVEPETIKAGGEGWLSIMWVLPKDGPRTEHRYFGDIDLILRGRKLQTVELELEVDEQPGASIDGTSTHE